MPVSDEFVAYVLDQFALWGGVTVKRMFGGAGLYRDGIIFGVLADNTAYLKVDESNRKQFEDEGMQQFKPFADKPTRMPYYEIPPEVLEDPEVLMEWAEMSLRIPSRTKK